MSKEERYIRIAVNPTRTTDINHHAWLLIFNPEIRGRCSHQPERRRVVYCQHGIPLLIGHLIRKSYISQKEARPG